MSDSNFSAIRARLRYESIEEFIDGYARFISAGGMFIPMAPNKLKSNGATVRFQFLLGDGSTALLGEGVVVQVRPPDPSNPAAPVGMLIKFSKLSQESKNLVDQIVAMKELGAVEAASHDDEARTAPASAGDGSDDPTYEMNLQEYLATAQQASAEAPAAEPEPAATMDSEPEEPVDAPQPATVERSEASEATHGPRKLAQTEGGLQILAFDDISAEQAGELAFDLGAEESDVDEMFAGLFGGGDAGGGDDLFGGMFGGGLEPAAEEPEPAEEAPSIDIDYEAEEPEANEAEESSEELAEESSEELAEESSEEFDQSMDESSDELAAAGDDEAPREEPSEAEWEAPLPYASEDGGSMLSFPSDWEEDEPSEAQVVVAQPADEESAEEPGPAEEDSAAESAEEPEERFGESETGAEESEAESLDLDSEAVEILEGSEAELLEEDEDEVAPSPAGFGGFDEFADDEPPPPPPAPAYEDDEEEFDDGPSELENLLGNLESDPREDRDMSLHLANDPLAAFEEEEAPAPPAADDDEESLDFLLAVAKSEIKSKHTDDAADKSGDILDSLLGDVADLPPPPADSPMFTAPPKKKKGFLSKLFGDD